MTINYISVRSVVYIVLLSAASIGIRFADHVSKESVTVSIDEVGELVGKESVVQGVSVQSFRGIPYAEPPVGRLRFKKPVLKSHLGRLTVQHFGSPCSQFDIYNQRFVGAEDCLTLNVFKPKYTTRDKPIPVMVWIHGGAYMRGSSMDYPGEALAALGDVIVVTLNYRLGIFGFFVSKNSSVPSNLGLWDQHTALLWVKENIAEFDGDPSSITIFGQSAGASSVIYQMFSPHNNKNIFQRAISESSWNEYLALVNRDVNAFNDRQITLLGCRNTNLLHCMNRMKTRELIMASIDGFSLQPYADGDFLSKDLGSSLVKNSLRKSRMSSKVVGNFYDYDLMAGWNSDEGTMFLALLSNLVPDPTVLTENHLKGFITERLFPMSGGSYLSQNSVAEKVINLYFSSTQNWITAVMPKYANVMEAIIKIFGDVALKLSNLQWLQFHSKCSSRNTFAYEFDYKARERLAYSLGTADFLRTGAQHDEEITFVFGLPFLSGYPDDLWTMLPNATMEEKALSQLMFTAWTNFAKFGDPGKEFKPFSYPHDTAYTKITIDGVEEKHNPMSFIQRFFATLQWTELRKSKLRCE